MKTHPYIDMDGVLVNFLKGASKFWGFDTLKENPRFNQIWSQLSERQKLEREWPSFWKDLEALPHALQLWEIVSPFNPHILTAVPDDGWPSCKYDKLYWCHKRLPNFGLLQATRYHGVYRHEKVQFAKNPDGTPNLLIDDFKRNIAEWEEAGGIGVKYTDGPEGLSKVKEALAEIYK